MSDGDLLFLKTHWPFWSHRYQDPPAGPWRHWLLLGGRGAGKTRAGAEWVNGEVEAGRAQRIGLIGETLHDARSVMVEGAAGLLHPTNADLRPAFDPSLRRLRWKNGAVGEVFSAEDPEQLRGPEFDLIWADEFAKWKKGQKVFDMAQMCLRQGQAPRMMVTTTPTAAAALRRLMADPALALTRAPTRANSAHLAAGFLNEMEKRYGGARLGRQELEGEILEDDDTALWRRAWIDASRVALAPPLTRIVVAVDPPVTSGPKADACGIVVAGRAADGAIYVIGDRTLQGASPSGWTRAVHTAVSAYGADSIVVETNQGGELVTAMLREAGAASVPVAAVSARLSKAARAAPVAAMYEQGRVRHVGSLAQLEDEMCRFGGIDAGAQSPDRVDAMVWAVTALTGNVVRPSVRSL